MIIAALNDKGRIYIHNQDTENCNILLMDEKKLFCKGKELNIISEILNLFIAEMFPRFLKKIQEEK